MTTVALLRTTYLNGLLKLEADGDTLPWTTTARDRALTDALLELWNDELGKRVSGTMATSQASDVYTLPAAFTAGTDGLWAVSRIELEYASGGISKRIDRATRWQRYSDTELRIDPLLPTDASLTLRVFGWIPFAATAADLPIRLEHVVAMKAAGLLYGTLAAHLANSQTQQGLDSGRVVDYPTAVGLSAYWERRYQDQVERDPARRSLAPRHSYR